MRPKDIAHEMTNSKAIPATTNLVRTFCDVVVEVEVVGSVILSKQRDAS